MTRRQLTGGTVFLAAAFGATGLGAIYIRVETERVPVARLVENLEAQLAKAPDNPQLHVNLARLHGMAWALKTEEVPAAIGPSQQLEPWYGYEPYLIPYGRDVVKGSAGERAAVQAHLDKALEHYQRALELSPDSLLGNLGYGWLRQQAGDKQLAIEHYRRVIAKAWPSEKEKGLAGPGARFFTNEAAGYLIPLLDPERDASEIRELRSMQAHFEGRPRAITPLAVPLSDDLPASAIHDRRARVLFDADGSGIRREWSWIGREAGWLVYDFDGRGEIASSLQLFGNVSFWLFWKNGYDALSALDDDGNGAIEGLELRGLGIWRDGNRNGISDRGEVLSLASHGIASLSCDYEERDGIEFAAISVDGVRMHDGRTRSTYDVILRSTASRTTRADESCEWWWATCPE
jgi:tetratricopeptide (TPR) repeat protein